MTTPAGGTARRSYRVFLRAYPREIRERRGEEMEETFLALWIPARRASMVGPQEVLTRG